MSKIIILGNGISGITAARHIRKRSDDEIIVISGETDHFFSRTALMYIFMGHMEYEHTKPYEDFFWDKNRISLVKTWIVKIDYEAKELIDNAGKRYKYDKLILATGSKPNKFGWPGQDLPGVQGLYSYQDLELLEENSQGTKHAVVVGGGLIGVELTEMLMSRGIKVTFLVREASFWNGVLPKQESQLIGRHILEHGVDLRLSTELKEIIAGSNGRVSKVVTNAGEEIDCQLVGLTAGVSPNVEFLKGGDLAIGRGIKVNQYLETNIEGVYALGDCAEFTEPVAGRKPIEQVWYTGRIMGESVAKTMTGQRTAYAPGHWFNSAKFFDIEYQTYGWVFSELKEGEADFYWEDKSGKICMHFVFESNTKKFLGLNTFGIRLRHEVFDRFLREERDMDHILKHLKDANFDPEFYKQYESEIIGHYNNAFDTAITPAKKSWKRILQLG